MGDETRLGEGEGDWPVVMRRCEAVAEQNSGWCSGTRDNVHHGQGTPGQSRSLNAAVRHSKPEGPNALPRLNLH
jgi:hypothetical protein